MTTRQIGLVLVLILSFLIIFIAIILTFSFSKRKRISSLRSLFKGLSHSQVQNQTRQSNNLDSPPRTPTHQTTTNTTRGNILISPPILNSSTSTLIDLESLMHNETNGNRETKIRKGFTWPTRGLVGRRKQSLSTSVSLSSSGGVELLSRNSGTTSVDRSNDFHSNLIERDIGYPPRFSSISLYSSPPSPSPLYSSHNIDIEVLAESQYRHSVNSNDRYRMSEESLENIDLSSPVLSNRSTFSHLDEVPPFSIGLKDEALFSHAPPNLPLPPLPLSLDSISSTSIEKPRHNHFASTFAENTLFELIDSYPSSFISATSSIDTLDSQSFTETPTKSILSPDDDHHSNLSTSADILEIINVVDRNDPDDRRFGFPPLPPTPPNTPPKLSSAEYDSSSSESSPDSSSTVTDSSKVENFPQIQVNGIALVHCNTEANRKSFQIKKREGMILVPTFKPEDVFDDKGVAC